MKKLFTTFFTTVLFLSLVSGVSAETTQINKFGLGYSLDLNNWQECKESDFFIYYMHNDNNNERIHIYKYSNENPENFTEDYLYNLYTNNIFSPEKLKEGAVNEYPPDDDISDMIVQVEQIKNGFINIQGKNVYSYDVAYRYHFTNQSHNDVYRRNINCYYSNGENDYELIYLCENENELIAPHLKDYESFINNIVLPDANNKSIKIKINNELVHPDSDPVIVNDRTLVPIRIIAEKLGYTVYWDAEIRRVRMENGNNTISLYIGDKNGLINYSEYFYFDVPAQIINDRTYLPLRAVTEAMGAEVNWNGDERMVEIFKN